MKDRKPVEDLHLKPSRLERTRKNGKAPNKDRNRDEVKAAKEFHRRKRDLFQAEQGEWGDE